MSATTGPPCSQCGRPVGTTGARGMCAAHYRATRRREVAAEEGREIRPPYRSDEPLTSISVTLPAGMVAQMDALGRRRRSATVRAALALYLARG